MEDKSKESETLNKEAEERKNKTLRIFIIISSIVLIVTAITLSIFHFWLGVWLIEIHNETNGRHDGAAKWCHEKSESLLESLPIWFVGRGLASNIDDSDAVFVLWERKYEAVPYVFEVFGHHDEDVRIAAARFIARYVRNDEENSQNIINRLLDLIANKNVLIRESSVLVTIFFNEELIEPFIPLLKERLYDDSLIVKGYAAYTFAKNNIYEKEIIQICIQMLKSSDQEHKDIALEIIEKLKEKAEPLIPILAETVIELYGTFHDEYIFDLLTQTGPSALPYLIERLKTCPVAHKPVFLRSIEKFGNKAKEVIPVVSKMVEHKDFEVRLSAAKAYIKIADKDKEKAYRVIFELCRHKDPMKRGEGVFLLNTCDEQYGDPDYPEIVSLLKEMLKDKDVWVQRSIISSLYSYGKRAKHIAPLLIQLYKDAPEGEVKYPVASGAYRILSPRENILDTIGPLGNNSPEICSFLEDIIRKGIISKGGGKKKLPHYYDRKPFSSALNALEMIGFRKENIPLLIQLLDDSSPIANKKALVGLKTLKSDAKPALDKIISHFSSEDHEIKFEAAFAVVEIVDDYQIVIKTFEEAVKKERLSYLTGYSAIAMTLKPGLAEYFRNIKEKETKKAYYDEEALEKLILLMETIEKKDTEKLKQFLKDKYLSIEYVYVIVKAMGGLGKKGDIELLKNLKQRYEYSDEGILPIIDNAIKEIESRIQEKIEKEKKD